MALAQTISVFVAVRLGFGRKTSLIPLDDLDSIAKSLYASQLLYVTAMCLSKVSTALLIARLTRVRKHLLATKLVSAFSGAWGIAAILALALRCNLAHPWSIGDSAQCVSPFTRWIGIETVDMLIELAIFGLAVFLVWGLQMSRKLKFVVVGAFLCRPLVIVTIAVRIYYIRPVYFNEDPYFNGVNAAILTQVCMHYALMAATIPCTKPFIKAFHSGYMDPEGYTAGSTPGTKQQGSGYGMQSAQSADGGEAAIAASMSQRSNNVHAISTDSPFNSPKNPSYKPSTSNYPASTHPLTSPESRRTLNDTFTATGRTSEETSLPSAVDAAFVAAQNANPVPAADKPIRVAPPVASPASPRLKDESSPGGLFRSDASMVRTTIEHDPLRRDAPTQLPGRRGQGSQENVGSGGLMIRQTREYEVSYEPA